jgi:hypothetical protein
VAAYSHYKNLSHGSHALHCRIRNSNSVAARFGSLVVKALYYKPESRGSLPDDVIFLNLPNPSSRSRPWGLLLL